MLFVETVVSLSICLRLLIQKKNCCHSIMKIFKKSVEGGYISFQVNLIFNFIASEVTTAQIST